MSAPSHPAHSSTETPRSQSPASARVWSDGPNYVELTYDPIDLGKVRSTINEPTCGAVVSFEGTSRAECNETFGHLHRLEYEAYEPMALRQLYQLAVQAQDRWGLNRTIIIHRLGAVALGWSSVLVLVASAHRAEAFCACQWLMDELKNHVAIWKKNVFENGVETWSQTNLALGRSAKEGDNVAFSQRQTSAAESDSRRESTASRTNGASAEIQ